jgi:trimeric autotransporter adhesin
MSQQVIDVGTSASDGTGDPLRDAFTKINDNFTELYSTVDNEGLTYGNVASNVTGITFNVTRYTESYAATPVLRGTGQIVGNVYVIRGNVLGGSTPLNDVLLTVTTLANVTVGNISTVSAIGVPIAPVLRVNGLTGNVTLTVNNIDGAASKAYVNAAIAANVANVVGSVTDSLSANITAANAVISNHAARITTLESNAATQATAITNLTNTKATIAYVDTSIGLALSSNAILANVAAVNANVAAANAAILLRANLTGAAFSGNITANSISATNLIRTDTYFIGGSALNQAEGQTFANPAALFFGNSALSGSPFYQINLQNLDSNGSGDIVVTADDGNDTSNYIAFGITGSNALNPNYPAELPHDGYVWITGGNLILQSNTNSIDFIAGNLATSQIRLTAANVLQLRSNVVIQFPDGTVQSTAFGGNASVTSINANIAAANVAIANLQSNAAAQALELNLLSSNAGSQATTINSLGSNAATQATQINLVNANLAAANTNITNLTASAVSTNANVAAANVNITALTANAASQALELNNLQSNAQAQQASIISLQSNAATQSVQIDLLNSNVTAANTNISSLTSNAATQAVQVNLLNANLTAANLNITTLFSNAASQALDINNLYTNVNVYLANVASSNANIAAANARIIVLDANLGSTTANVSTLQSNAVTQASQINLLNANVTAANTAIQTKANLSGAVFTGNVQANYLLANANVKIGSSLEVGNASPISYPGQGGVFVGNVNGYYQVVVQNTNNGSSASGDFVITANDGTDTNNYINIGVNSSGFVGNFTVPAGDTGLQEFPHDGYLNVIGGNAVIRTDGNIFMVANTSVAGLLKDGDFVISTGNLRFKDGTIQSTGNIGALSYTPNTSANYNGTITNIQQALDELAARLRALGG